MSDDTAKADAFLDLVKNNLPEAMTPDHITRLLTGIIMSYAAGPNDAKEMLLRTLFVITAKYAERAADGEGECDCPTCRAERAGSTTLH